MATKLVTHDHPGLEPPIDNEESKVDELIAIINRVQQHNFSQHRHFFRATHVKVQAIVKGTLEILPDLAPELAQGLASPDNQKVSHPIAIRYANEPSFLQDDRAPGPRGCGMKIFNVSPSAEGFLSTSGTKTQTQDLTFNNAPMLELRDLPTTVEIFKIRESNFFQPDNIAKVIKSSRSDADTQLAPATLPNHHFLGYTMYSQSAYRWGDYVAKYALYPTGTLQQRLAEDKTINDSSEPDQHSQWLREYFANNDATYDLRVQLLENVNEQSVEDTSAPWDEEKYPFRTVGKVTIPKQDSFHSERRAFWDDGMKLNVWDGLVEHRPMGSVNRLRGRLYEASRKKREEGNAKPVRDVSSIDEIP